MLYSRAFYCKRIEDVTPIFFRKRQKIFSVPKDNDARFNTMRVIDRISVLVI